MHDMHPCQCVFLPFLCFSCMCGSFFFSARVLSKLPLSSQWVTCWPPQDCVYVSVAITRHGGSGPGVWACFNTRHRWVALWARCGSLPSAASSGCPDNKIIRLTVTRTPISSHCTSVIVCLALLLSLSPLPVAVTAEDTLHLPTHCFMGKECVGFFLFCFFLAATVHNPEYWPDSGAAEKQLRWMK